MACLAQFMVVLDSAIVTVALPQMRAGLGLSASQQQWVISGYLITLGGFLLLAARAGDLFGRKRVFLLGAVVFTAASVAGGLASGPAMAGKRPRGERGGAGALDDPGREPPATASARPGHGPGFSHAAGLIDGR
ncbi:MAG: MFS transporter [Actinoallomurus sp.]